MTRARFLLVAYIVAAIIGGMFVGHTMLKNRRIARNAEATAVEAKQATQLAKRVAVRAEAAAQAAHNAAQDANRALCIQRSSTKHRLQTAQDFKSHHPRGTEDFSLTLINRSIRNAQMDLRALKGVECPFFKNGKDSNK